MIRYEKEVVQFLNLPKIPKKEWDGKTAFKNGVAVVTLVSGDQAYATATFGERESGGGEIKIKKVFTLEPFVSIDKCYIVPNYMDEDVDNFDMDEQSKDRARFILEEAHELERDGIEQEPIIEGVNEWVFPEIHNREEAEAYVRSYRKRNRIKGKCPSNADDLKAYLYVIASDKKYNRTK